MTHLNNFVSIFLVFGAAYLLSSLLRGVTAALASSFVLDFDLASAELGLLGGSYFLGFALMQLLTGAWLDRYGAKRVLAASLVLAAMGIGSQDIVDSHKEVMVEQLTRDYAHISIVSPLRFSTVNTVPYQLL